MAKGITHSCAHVWRHIARAGGWWSVLRVAREWDGVFSLDEIGEHLVTLQRGGFLKAIDVRREGTVYAFTADCLPLPGESIRPVTSQPEVNVDVDAAAVPPAPPAPRPENMTGHYVPPKQTYRSGAMDYAQHPSLHMGQRRAHQGGAQ